MDEQKLNELVTQLSSRFSQAQQVLEQYKQGQVELQQVNEELKVLNEIEGKFSIEVGSVIRKYYLEVIEAKRMRYITDLGYTP